MELIESVLGILFGEVPLLSAGDWLESLPVVTQNRTVQAQPWANGAGTSVRAFDRRNCTHTLNWSVVRVHESVARAEAFLWMHTLALNALNAGQSATLSISGVPRLILNSAALLGYPSALTEHLTRFSYTLTGGALTGLNPLLGTEEGGLIELEAGGFIQLEGS